MSVGIDQALDVDLTALSSHFTINLVVCLRSPSLLEQISALSSRSPLLRCYPHRHTHLKAKLYPKYSKGNLVNERIWDSDSSSSEDEDYGACSDSELVYEGILNSPSLSDEVYYFRYGYYNEVCSNRSGYYSDICNP